MTINKTELLEKQREKIAALKKQAIKVRSPQSKILLKLQKQNFKHLPKENADKKTIYEIIKDLDENTTLKVISNKFDSPNILSVLHDKYNIKELIISTWAVTPIGISRLKKLSDAGIEIIVLLDKTHSYKWTFESGAYRVLTNVKFIFSENHSKFILADLKTGPPINFIGSFNLSNNPRYENIEINRSRVEFDFYKDFVIGVKSGKFEVQKQLFNE